MADSRDGDCDWIYGYCGAHLNDQKRILSSANGHESVTATEH